MDVFGVALQRYVLAGLAALTAIVFWSGASDPVNLPKATLVAVAAVLLLAVGLVRVAALRRVVLLSGPIIWAATALAVGLLLATATSDVPRASVTGALGRSDGLMLYGACLVCFVTVLRVFDQDTLRLLVYGLLSGGVFLVAYGLLQAADVDPVSWADIGYSNIIGTLGNPDFEAAYVGIVLPLAIWGGLTRTWSRNWRIASLALAAGCVGVALLSGVVQGVIAGAAGVLVVGVGLLLAREDRLGRRLAAAGVATVAVFAALVAVVIVTGAGPADRFTSAGSVSQRKWYWSSALDMWSDHPWFGVGLDRYGAFYRAVRPESAADVSNYSDAAHSVPLHLLATGGVAVAGPYLVLVLLVLVALVRGLLRLTGEARLLLAGVGGAWFAYQVQSLVSIDQPALAVTQWLLGGAVVALAWPPRRVERLLPGAATPKTPRGRAVLTPQLPEPNWSGGTVAVMGLVGVGAVLALWQVVTPLSADRAARAGREHLARGEGNAALDSFTAATNRAPYVAAYWLQRGNLLEQVQQAERAMQSYAAGIRHDPRSYDLLQAAAVLAKKQGDTAAVARLSSQLSEVDPSGSWRRVLAG